MKAHPPKLLEIGVYLALALWAIAPALQAGHAVGSGVDLYGTIWFYWWTQDSLLALRDPGFTDLFFHPLGKDIFAHTGNNLLDALIAAPMFWLLGNPDYEPWFVAAILVANALSFRKLAGYALARGGVDPGIAPWAAFGAAALWELNPFVCFEITCGRLTQGFLVFTPLAIYHLLRCEEEGPRWRHAVLAGIFTGLQAWTYWFMGWFLAFAFSWIALYGLWRAGPARRRLLARYVGAGIACLLSISPAIFAMAAASSSGEVPGLSEAAGSIFEPPPAQANNVATNLHGYLLVERFGVPIFGSLAWGAPALLWAALGPGRARWLPAALVVMAFSIGPMMDLPGRGPTVMPHYMAAYYYLPWFDRLWFPYRMVGVPVMIAALGAGFLLARWLKHTPRWTLAPLLAAWLGVTAWEQGRYAVLPFAHTDISPPKSIGWLAEQGGGIVDMPYGIYSESVIWQTLHGQPLFGGMGENAPLLWPEGHAERLRNPLIAAMRRATIQEPGRWDAPTITDRAIDEVIDWGFRWVVLRRDLIRQPIRRPEPGIVDLNTPADLRLRSRALTRFSQLLGPPTAADELLIVWDLEGRAEPPGGLAPNLAELAKPVHAPDPRPAYEIALQEAGRMNRPGGGDRK